MQKYTSFAITSAILLTAMVTVTLYTVSRANAQGDETSGQEHNMTNATGGEEHTMTNAAGGEEHNMTNATKEVAAVGTCITIGRGDAAHAVC